MKTPFKIIKQSKHSRARVGQLETPHGTINTPVFMPVGTQASVKALTPTQLKACNSQIILANTYHLSLRPTSPLIKEMGGLHPFMGWDKPILTDSGGFQVFSLSNNRKIDETGVTFKSHIDGSPHRFTPKNVVDHQINFNSDILMPLDICTPYPATKTQTETDLDLSTKWEHEAYEHWESLNVPNLLFAIVQGGMYKDLRDKSVEGLLKKDFPGYAIGGVSVGEPLEKMYPIVEHTTPQLPENKPRYLMGVGEPDNLSVAINAGIDMFDCVLPTRLARHGTVYGPNLKKLSIKNAQYKSDPSPIDPNCPCETCQHFSRAYLRHLFLAKEILAMTLLSIHNIFAIVSHVEKIRQRILEE